MISMCNVDGDDADADDSDADDSYLFGFEFGMHYYLSYEDYYANENVLSSVKLSVS